jgi:hypothetical protein
MIAAIRRALARRRLARDVERRRQSFELQQFRKHREAALKGKRRVVA